MIKRIKRWIGASKRKKPCLVQSEEEWLQEMKQRYSTFQEVAFRCPSCGQIQQVGDLVEKDLDVREIYQVCHHCQKHIRQMQVVGRYVVTKNGQQHPLFDFG
jgi:hypothetical protein